MVELEVEAEVAGEEEKEREGTRKVEGAPRGDGLTWILCATIPLLILTFTLTSLLRN